MPSSHNTSTIPRTSKNQNKTLGFSNLTDERCLNKSLCSHRQRPARNHQRNVNSSRTHHHTSRRHRDYYYPARHSEEPEDRPRQRLSRPECVELIRQMLPKSGRITIKLQGGHSQHHSGRSKVCFHLNGEPQEPSGERDDADAYERRLKALCRLVEDTEDAADHPVDKTSPQTKAVAKTPETTVLKPKQTRSNAPTRPADVKSQFDWATHCKQDLSPETKWNQPLVSDCDYENELANHPRLGNVAPRRNDADERLVQQLDRIVQQMEKNETGRQRRDPFHVDRKQQQPDYHLSPETLEMLMSVEDPAMPDSIRKRDLKQLLKEAIQESTNLSKEDPQIPPTVTHQSNPVAPVADATPLQTPMASFPSPQYPSIDPLAHSWTPAPVQYVPMQQPTPSVIVPTTPLPVTPVMVPAPPPPVPRYLITGSLHPTHYRVLLY